MNIIISGLFLYPGKVGGSENYLYNLLEGFSKHENIKLAVNSKINYKNSIIKKYHNIFVNVKINRGFYDLFLSYFIKNIKNYDLILSPNYITSLFNKKIKKVTTIHDVRYLYYSEFFTLRRRLWLHISNFITLIYADKIICISNNVKDDLIKYFGTKYSSKIEVVYNPIDFKRFNFSKKNIKINIPNKYIFSITSEYQHKNLITLIRSFNKLDKKNGYKLVIAGFMGEKVCGKYKKYFKKVENEINKNHNNILTMDYVSDQYLGYLYQQCDLFVYPSLFEGFGMPPIEAMGFGKPTITTKCGSLKEVTLNKAIYVNNPTDADELALLIETTIMNLDEHIKNFEKLKNEIRKKYHPQFIANQYLKIFNKIVS